MVKIKNNKLVSGKKTVRRLSDISDYFLDKKAVKKLLRKNPLIYEYYEIEKPDLAFATTIIKPGKIGKEFYMTKGHSHADKKASEIYFGLNGKGIVLMQKGNKCIKQEITKDAVVYVPAGFAHRTINTGKKDLAFLTVYHLNAGHDYKVKFLKRIFD